MRMLTDDVTESLLTIVSGPVRRRLKVADKSAFTEVLREASDCVKCDIGAAELESPARLGPRARP